MLVGVGGVFSAGGIVIGAPEGAEATSHRGAGTIMDYPVDIWTEDCMMFLA